MNEIPNGTIYIDDLSMFQEYGSTALCFRSMEEFIDIVDAASYVDLHVPDNCKIVQPAENEGAYT